MFASRITKIVTLPSDPAVSVTIRKLSGLQLKAARQASQQESARNLIALGGGAFMKEWKALQADEPAAVTPTALADPMLTHDLLTVLVSGVRSWSVPEPVDREHLADLSDQDAEHLAREILTLSLPAVRSEDEEKNAAGPSTVV